MSATEDRRSKVIFPSGFGYSISLHSAAGFKASLSVCLKQYFVLSKTQIGSVADPGCLSRIPHPDFYPFRIPDPKTATKERGEKKLVVKPFLEPQISQN